MLGFPAMSPRKKWFHVEEMGIKTGVDLKKLLDIRSF